MKETNNMAHWKTFMDPGKFLGPADFGNEGREVTISRIAREKMPKRDGEEEKSGTMLYIQTKDGSEYPRAFKVPKSVMYGLSLHLGTDAAAWIGKRVHIFAAMCMSFGEKEECLRIRFPADVDDRIRKWLKKRKASPMAYMITERQP